MEIPSDLQVLSELAITLAGFTGLLGVLRHRRERPMSEREKMIVTTLLLSAVFVVLLSFVPSWLQLIPGLEPDVWAWSIRVLLVGHLIAWAIGIFYNRMGRAFADSLPPIERILAWFFSVTGLVAVLVEVTLVLGYFVALTPFVYEGVLIFFLALGLTNFLVLLLNPES